MNVDVLIKKIEENKIVIYGTGYVSQRFYEILVRRNLTNHLMYFIILGNRETRDARAQS